MPRSLSMRISCKDSIVKLEVINRRGGGRIGSSPSLLLRFQSSKARRYCAIASLSSSRHFFWTIFAGSTADSSEGVLPALGGPIAANQRHARSVHRVLFV